MVGGNGVRDGEKGRVEGLIAPVGVKLRQLSFGEPQESAPSSALSAHLFSHYSLF